MPTPPVWQLQDHDALLFDCDGTLADTLIFAHTPESWANMSSTIIG